MIPSFDLAVLGMKYGAKILACLLAIGVIWGYINHWAEEHQEIGRLEERANWKKRDEDTNRQSDELLKLKTHEVELIREFQHKQFNGAIETYANYIDNLITKHESNQLRDTKITTTSSDRNTLSGASSCPENTDRPSPQALSEIELEKSIKACELLIEEFLKPNSVIK